jgi:N-acyl-D-amino-acid deacylase
VLFDPATVRDEATFSDPKHYSTGVRYVFVNGCPVVSEGKITDERPGRPLYGPGRKERGELRSRENAATRLSP